MTPVTVGIDFFLMDRGENSVTCRFHVQGILLGLRAHVHCHLEVGVRMAVWSCSFLENKFDRDFRFLVLVLSRVRECFAEVGSFSRFVEQRACESFLASFLAHLRLSSLFKTIPKIRF